MPSPRSIAIARRTLSFSEEVSDLSRTAHDNGHVRSLSRHVRNGIIEAGQTLDPYAFPDGADIALASVLDTNAELTDEVLQEIAGITDATRRAVFLRMLERQRKVVPPEQANGYSKFPTPFHANRGKLGAFCKTLKGDHELLSQHLRIASGFFTIAERIRTDLGSQTANKIGVELADKAEPPFTKEMQEKLLLHFLSQYSRLTGDPDAKNHIPVQFPRIPGFNEQHIGYDEERELALEIMDVVLNDNFDGPILQRKAGTGAKATPSIAEQLKKYKLTGFKKFRKELLEAGPDALLCVDDMHRKGYNPLAHLPGILDDPALENHPVVLKLKSLPTLLFKRASDADKSSRRASMFDSWFSGSTDDESTFRKVRIDPSALNPSVGLLLSDALPKESENFSMHTLLSQLLSDNIPGIQTPQQFLESVQARRGTRNMEDILIFLFDSMTTLDYAKLRHILDVLFQHNVRELPAECKATIAERFQMDDSIVNRYEALAEHYRPVTLTTIPDGVMLLTNVGVHLNPDPDILGMRRDADAIAEHLESSDAVCVVDGTHYEDSRGFDFGKDDDDDSDVGFPHRDPSERAVQSFIYNLMRGSYPDLADYSVVALHNDEDFKSIFRLFFSIMHDNDDDDDDKSPEDDRAAVEKMEKTLVALKKFNKNVILVVGQDDIRNARAYATVVKYLSRFGIKLIIRGPDLMPGVARVNIQPFTDSELGDRLVESADEIPDVLDIAVDDDQLRQLARNVGRQRTGPLQDPSQAAIAVLHGAAGACRAEQKEVRRPHLSGAHIASGLASAFGSIDPIQAKLLLDKLVELRPILLDRVCGQEQMIDSLIRILRQHLLGMRVAFRPTATLITGPTGVGKTEVIMAIANFFGLPYLELQGGEFTERHHVDMLTGSPPGYKDEGEGTLTKFMADHQTGIVFIDEIEKGHSSLRSLLMNTFWTGKLRSKHGTERHRPGFIYIGASNAGADRITPHMKRREINEVLAKAFAEAGGETRPEFIARFSLVQAHPILEPDFLRAIERNVRDIVDFPAFMAHDLQIGSVDPAAVQLLFEECKDICTSRSTGGRIQGFSGLQSGGGENRYFNLRQISASLSALSDVSADDLSTALNRSGAEAIFGNGPRLIDVKNDGGRIVLVPRFA